MSNSLVRYASDRYLEIELIMNKKTGLKIPGICAGAARFLRDSGGYVIKNVEPTAK